MFGKNKDKATPAKKGQAAPKTTPKAKSGKSPTTPTAVPAGRPPTTPIAGPAGRAGNSPTSPAGNPFSRVGTAPSSPSSPSSSSGSSPSPAGKGKGVARAPPTTAMNQMSISPQTPARRGPRLHVNVPPPPKRAHPLTSPLTSPAGPSSRGGMGSLGGMVGGTTHRNKITRDAQPSMSPTGSSPKSSSSGSSSASASLPKSAGASKPPAKKLYHCTRSTLKGACDIHFGYDEKKYHRHMKNYHLWTDLQISSSSSQLHSSPKAPSKEPFPVKKKPKEYICHIGGIGGVCNEGKSFTRANYEAHLKNYHGWSDAKIKSSSPLATSSPKSASVHGSSSGNSPASPASPMYGIQRTDRGQPSAGRGQPSAGRGQPQGMQAAGRGQSQVMQAAGQGVQPQAMQAADQPGPSQNPAQGMQGPPAPAQQQAPAGPNTDHRAGTTCTYQYAPGWGVCGKSFYPPHNYTKHMQGHANPDGKMQREYRRIHRPRPG